MNTEEILQKLKDQNPRLVYLSGKTCTGKTTFANCLEHHEYKKIELDKIVLSSVVKPFNVVPEGVAFRTVYRDLEPKEHTNIFINSARSEIFKELQESSLVVEGAIASPRVVSEIFSNDLKDFVFIYFHPVNADAYEKRILSRLVDKTRAGNSGLPKDFWQLVQESDLNEFNNTNTINQGIKSAVNAYVTKSMEESKSRLENFQASFPEIIVVEI